MRCPRDRAELFPTEVEGLHLDTCPDCRGIWFDAGELKEARDHVDPHVAWLDFDLWKHPESFALRPASAPCPRCSNSMCRIEYGDSGVEIDACPFCHGVWLDERELADILTALQREAQERPLGELMLESLREALDIVLHPSRAASDWRDLKEMLRLVRRRVFSERARVAEMLTHAGRSNPLS